MIVGWTYLGIGVQVVVYRCIPETFGLSYKLIGLRAQIEGVKGRMYN